MSMALLRGVRSLTRVGVRGEDSPLVAQPIVLANGIALAALVVTLLVQMSTVAGGTASFGGMMYATLMGLGPSGAVIWMNAQCRSRAASVLLNLHLWLSTLGAAVVMGGATAGIHYFYLPWIVLTFMSFPTAKRRLALAFAMLVAASFVVISVFMALVPSALGDPAEFRETFAMNMSLIAVSTVILAGYAHSVTLSTRAELRRVRRETDALLYEVLPQSFVAELREGAEVVGRRSRCASVVVVDIVGFTRLSEERAPEDLVDLLNETFGALDRACATAGAEKIKTVGDAYVAGVGLGGAGDRPGEDATVLARAMVAAVEGSEACHGINIRAGVGTGEVIDGVVRTSRFAYDAWGEAIDRAFAMEAAAAPGEVMVDLATWTRLCDPKPKGVSCGETAQC